MPFTFFTSCNVFQSTYANSTITFEVGNLSLGNISVHVRVIQQNDIDGTLMEEINYRVELFSPLCATVLSHCFQPQCSLPLVSQKVLLIIEVCACLSQLEHMCVWRGGEGRGGGGRKDSILLIMACDHHLAF